MDPPEIALGFPAPRDDEPASLRQDIVDELADHLHCALNRELHRAPDGAIARQRVLARFGDPQQLARQLWFQAMREKIMSQRLMLALSSLMLVVCVVLAFFVWRLAEQNREANAALLDKLAAIAIPEPIPASATPDWIPFKVRLLEGGEAASPAEGFTVSLLGRALSEGERIQLREKTGPDGTADFGVVRAGQYQLILEAPWGEIAHKEVLVGPGRPNPVRLSVPTSPALQGRAAFEVNWPDDLHGERLWVVADLRPELRKFEGLHWGWSNRIQRLVVTDDGRGVLSAVPGNGFITGSANYIQRDGTLELRPHEEPQPVLQLPGPGFRLQSLAVLRMPENVDLNESTLALPVLGTYSFPDEAANAAGSEEGELPSFEIRPGGITQWQIPLPEELLNTVRAKLSEERPRD